MGRLLSRFVFTLLIISGFLFYEGYRRLNAPAGGSGWEIGLYFLAGGIGVGLAIRGFRERYRGGPPGQ